ncbi:MAG TPA: hypothetical protein VIM31_02765 [Candidatus Microsaccharimonas sp.]|jgi:hypothetical protein
MDSMEREQSEMSALWGESPFTPELKFVTDLGNELLLTYGTIKSESFDTQNHLVWHHDSGDFAMSLSNSVLKSADKLRIVGTDNTFQFVTYNRGGEDLRVISKTLVIKYPIDISADIEYHLVEYESLYIEAQRDWCTKGASAWTKPTDGDLAWFEVGLSLMKTDLESRQ